MIFESQLPHNTVNLLFSNGKSSVDDFVGMLREHLIEEEGEVFLGEVADQELQGEGGYSLNANIMF